MTEADIILNPILAGAFMDTLDKIASGIGGAGVGLLGALLTFILIPIFIVIVVAAYGPSFFLFYRAAKEKKYLGVMLGVFAWVGTSLIPDYGFRNGWWFYRSLDTAEWCFFFIRNFVTVPISIALGRWIQNLIFDTIIAAYKRKPDVAKVARNPDVAKVAKLKLNDFKVKNLVRCGEATACLFKENKVRIVGGSSEEKEAARQWVEENHPEYEIT